MQRFFPLREASQVLFTVARLSRPLTEARLAYAPRSSFLQLRSNTTTDLANFPHKPEEL
jgi:hypothetical protein